MCLGASSGRLPIELLQLIFLMALEECPDDPSLVEWRTLQTSITSCSQVCRTWRLAARGYNRLWSHAIDFERHSLERSHELLALSYPHPFNVGHRTAPVSLHRKKGLCELLVAHKDRIREWNVYCTELKTSDRFPQVFTSTALCLESFRWHGPISNLGPPQVDDMERFRLVFPMPLLRRVSLTSCNLPLRNGMPFWNLTELHVSEITAPHSTPTVPEWLDILRSVPHLQFLSIFEAILHSQVSFSSLVPLNLFDLRLISIGEGRTGSGHFIPLLVLIRPSPMCGLVLKLPDTIYRGYLPILRLVFTSMFSIVTQDHHLSEMPIELCLDETSGVSIGNVSDPDLTLDWNGPRGSAGVLSYLNSREYPPVSIHVPTAQSSTYAHAFRLLFQALCPSVTSMRLSLRPIARQRRQPYSSGGIFLELAIGLLALSEPSMKRLTLDEESTIILSVLMEFQEDTAIFPLPGLESLCFDNVVLKRDALDIITSYLEWRFSCGYPIQSVRFQRSYIGKGVAKELELCRNQGFFSEVIYPSQESETFAQFCRRK